jgi:hypothetical protein
LGPDSFWIAAVRRISKERKPSFLKKRSKKLLLPRRWSGDPGYSMSRLTVLFTADSPNVTMASSDAAPL